METINKSETITEARARAILRSVGDRLIRIGHSHIQYGGRSINVFRVELSGVLISDGDAEPVTVSVGADEGYGACVSTPQGDAYYLASDDDDGETMMMWEIADSMRVDELCILPTGSREYIVLPVSHEAPAPVSSVKKIAVSGNSLVVPVTNEAQALGLDRGDYVKITLERRD